MHVQELTKQYDGKTVVDGVSFAIPKGKVISLIGPNGAGKSTVMGMISRLIAHDSGLIDFEGKDIGKWKSKELSKRLAILTQSNNIQMKLTVRELVTFGRFPYSGNRVTLEDQKIIDRAISYMELEGFQDRFIDELSGGQRQRAMIAMAMSCDPEILIADEPTTALDVTVQAQVLEQLNKLRKESNTALIIITHNLGVVARYADTVKIMYGGKIVESGTPFDIFENPQHPYTIGLVRAVPRLDLPRSHGLHTIPGEPPDMSRIPEQSCAFAGRCPHATQECHTKRPPFVSVGEGHECACFHMDETKAEREALV